MARPSELPQVATAYQEENRKEPGSLGILLYFTGGRGMPWSRPAREHGVWITLPFWDTEIEDKAASRLLSGLAVPQGEVVHREHAGLVLRGQELPARREIWFLPSYLLIPFPFIHSCLGWAKRATPLCFRGLAGRKYELLIGGAPDDVPSNSCLFQSQMCCI